MFDHGYEHYYSPAYTIDQWLGRFYEEMIDANDPKKSFNCTPNEVKVLRDQPGCFELFRERAREDVQKYALGDDPWEEEEEESD